ncbi:DedA family protein [Ostreiculturibacter nitratireducens]|uniref:DedA family protein n=1 Tax=Ostreiculturibacter nitratireducens TaxID=3075226 RepID=UPI0031B5F63A
MTDWLLALVPTWGLWLLAATTFLSCLALPVPSSLIMLTAGGFVASGDLVLWQVAGAAYVGAILGDNAGFFLGRRGGAGLLEKLKRNPKRAGLIARAETQMQLKGRIAVFLTRWLLSPLGPWVNIAGGAAGFPWRRFILPEAAGEAVWVTAYVGMGFAFAGNIEAANDLIGSALGFLGAFGAALALGFWLRAAIRQGRRANHGAA